MKTGDIIFCTLAGILMVLAVAYVAVAVFFIVGACLIFFLVIKIIAWIINFFNL